MSKVLILGAGASYGHGLEGEKKPPLAKGFFSGPVCEEVATDYEALLDYMESTLHIDLHDRGESDIENVFASVEPSWKMGLQQQRDLRALLRGFPRDFVWASPVAMLSSFIVDIIHISTSWLANSTCPFHDVLVTQWLDEGDCVISFNYDLVMDTSLARSGRWSETTGYGWALVGEGYTKRESEILLLKLHGSTNWWRSTELEPTLKSLDEIEVEYKSVDTIEVQDVEEAIIGKTPRGDIHSPPRITPGWCELWHAAIPDIESALRDEWSWRWKVLETFSSSSYPEMTSLKDRLPLLVMPTPYKSFEELTFGPLRPSWYQAGEALEKCEEILAIGFSFRDPHFTQILAEVLGARDKPPSFKLVRPAGGKDEKKFRSRLRTVGVKVEPLNQTLEDYVSRL